MKSARTYRMTVASTWYDAEAGVAREYEMHFKVARRGRIQTVRLHLAKKGATYFQQAIYRRTGRWIRKRKIRISFEREEPATKGQNTITVEARSMQYRGREWGAVPLPSRTLSYAKRRRRRVRRGRG